jgi:peptidoglycan/LPS O-acetylase OafA/YrhL
MNKKLEIIDFLKGYSMLSIVIYHFGQTLGLWPILARMIGFGGTGVHTFIFVSGFGLYLSHLRQPLSFPQFLKKRFTKVYIPYIIIVSVSALISFLVPIYANSAYAFFGHVFLYKMFDDDIMSSYGYQLWFISTIIQFYFIFPFLVRMKERLKDWPFILIGLGISITWGIFVVRTGRAGMRIYNGAFFLYLWEFMLGMLLAEKFFVNGYEFWKMKKVYLMLLSVVGIGAYALMALTLGAYGRLLNDVPALIGYTCLSVFLYRCSLAWLNSFVLFTAKISYPLYLVHILILLMVIYGINYYRGVYSWPVAIVILLLCLLVAYWLEKFFRWVDQALFGPGKASLAGKVIGVRDRI